MAVDLHQVQEESIFERLQQRITDLVRCGPEEVVVVLLDGSALKIVDVRWAQVESMSHTSHTLQIVVENEKEEPK